MIAVVTGASGFIGRHLVRRLLAEGHIVRCLVRADSGGVPPGATRHHVDYESAASLLNCDALDEAAVVFHLAGATRAAGAEDYTRANVTPTRHLLSALASRRLRPRLVYVSSQAAAGPAVARDLPVREDDPPRPIDAYGRSKLEAERVVETFGDVVPFTIVRPSAVLGPGDRDFFELFRWAMRGLVIYPGTRHHWLSLLAVQDAVEGIQVAARTERAVLRQYFLASDSPVQWQEVGKEVAAAAGRPVRHLNLPSVLVDVAAWGGDILSRFTGRALLANRAKATLARAPFWVCSNERARLELGFRPRHSLPQMIRETYLWYSQNGWLRAPGASTRAGVA
ncbi:MAG TPA: NAD-dependent epimerase/dehydratase family protein [Gemmatimonadaceae bacterium]|nr:NAD-dependent epimerase/dehydratase family protein [Gemmatimonadaceae bacterium]